MSTTAPTVAPAWTAETINRALFNHFATGGWSVLFEVSAHTDATVATAGVRRIDVLLIRKARRMGIGLFELLAIEVKVSRADFLSDVRRPEKQAPWREVAHRHAYAVPEGLVSADEVPAESGLIVVSRKEGSQYVAHPVRFERRAPMTATRPEFPTWLTNTLVHRASWSEARLKGWSGVHTYNTSTDTVEELRGKLDAAQRELEKVNRRMERIAVERDMWKGVYATVGGLPCEFCAQPLKPGRPGRAGYFDRWVHVKKAHEEVCELAREAYGRDAARARWDALPDQEKNDALDQRDYGHGRPEPEQIIREWSYTNPARPTDSLLPEGVTHE